MRLGAIAQSGLVCSKTKRILPIGGIARESVDTPPARRVRRKGEGGAGAAVDEVVEVDGSTTEDDGQGAPLDQRENEADPGSDGEGGIPDACTDSEDSPAAAPVEQQSEARAPTLPSFAQAKAAIARLARSGRAAVLMAAALPKAAEGATTTFTCVEGGGSKAEEGSGNWLSMAVVVAACAAVAIAFVAGRWSADAPRDAAAADGEPWIMVVNETAGPTATPNRGEAGRAASHRTGTTTKNVASQAPCTYTFVRKHAKGRFLPLPESAHG